MLFSNAIRLGGIIRRSRAQRNQKGGCARKRTLYAEAGWRYDRMIIRVRAFSKTEPELRVHAPRSTIPADPSICIQFD